MKFSLRTPYRTGLVQAEETPTMWKRKKNAIMFSEASNKSVVSSSKQNTLEWKKSQGLKDEENLKGSQLRKKVIERRKRRRLVLCCRATRLGMPRVTLFF